MDQASGMLAPGHREQLEQQIAPMRALAAGLTQPRDGGEGSEASEVSIDEAALGALVHSAVEDAAREAEAAGGDGAGRVKDE